MALFQFRRGRDEQAAKLAPAQTVAAMRRRATHRLIGAAVLVLAGVIGFPLVFDNQPRPIPVDLPIEIADKNKVKPLPTPAPVAPAAAAAAAPTPAAIPMPAREPVPVAAPTPPPAPAVPVALAPVPNPARTSGPVTEAPATNSAEAGKAQALLDGKDVPAKVPASEARFVVQVGAFSEPEKVREVRQKVERAGFKTYTQVVETKDGSRTRVRVGPFPEKEEAQKVAEKIRKLDLSPAILTL